MTSTAAEHAFVSPFQKVYFSDELVAQYEPLALSWEAVVETEGKDKVAMEEYNKYLKKYRTFETCSNWDGKIYDIVFYGVSGYTGYLMMQYLKRVALKVTPEPFTFAFAGRTVRKVEEMRDREFAGTQWADTPVLMMSYDDPVSIIDLVKSARVIINVAGPYMATQGELLIDLCIDLGVSYVDISGEIPWSLRIMELHKKAVEAGVIVVPSAASAGGFPDLATYLCAQKMREEYGEELRTAICYCSGGGTDVTASGGTLKTRSIMASAGDEVRAKMGDPFALGGFIPERDRWGVKACSIEFGTGKTKLKSRSEDLDANVAKISEDKRLGIWRGPHIYSYFDTRIVRRSNMLMADLANRPYGVSLNFLEFSMLPTDAIMAAAQASSRGVGRAQAGSVEDEKRALQAKGAYYKEGEGPQLEELDDAWTGYFMWAETANGHEVKCSFVGRDGYIETARVAIETAMCLLFDKLPFRGGVLTPTVACGESLLRRMVAGNLKFQMGEWLPAEERRPPPWP